MQFPFSFWGADPFNGIVKTVELTENFTGWFTAWNPIVQTLEFFEDFFQYLVPAWGPIVETPEFFDNFDSGW